MAILRADRAAGFFYGVLAVSGALFLCLPSRVSVAEETVMRLQENKIKAGLVYNFLKYTKWPEYITFSEGQTLQVCLLGGDSFGGALLPLQGRTAQRFIIHIRHISAAREASACHVVFIHRSMAQGLQGVLDALPQRNVLTVSDIGGFARNGGMVELSTQRDQRIHLYINKKEIDQASLGVEDRLLKLAKVIG